MGREEDVDAYYEQLIKFNNAFVVPWAQDSFLKEMLRFKLQKKLKILISGMPKHTLEEVMESAK